MNDEARVRKLDVFLRLVRLQERADMVNAVREITTDAVVIVVSELEDSVQASELRIVSAVLVCVLDQVIQCIRKLRLNQSGFFVGRKVEIG